MSPHTNASDERRAAAMAELEQQATEYATVVEAAAAVLVDDRLFGVAEVRDILLLQAQANCAISLLKQFGDAEPPAPIDVGAQLKGAVVELLRDLESVLAEAIKPDEDGFADELTVLRGSGEPAETKERTR